MVNNKVYIGQTIKKLNQRMHGHLADAKRNRSTKLARAIRKYGENNFISGELIACNSSDELNKMELYFIEKYKSIDDKYGYNIRIGGECGFKISEETKKKLSISSKNAAQKARENGGHWSSVKCSEEKKKHLSKLLSSELNPKNKPVYMYDKQGNFIERFHSARESARKLGKSCANIVSCCNNKLKSAYGYRWYYEENILTML